MSPSNFAVSNTHILYFVPGETTETDVINSTLLAQLSAVSSANSVDKADEWIARYTEIAAVAAWVLQSGTNFKIAAKDVISVSTDITAIKVIEKESGIKISGLLKELLYLKGKKPVGLKILDENGKTNSSGSFQLVTCEKSGQGDISLSTFIVYAAPKLAFSDSKLELMPFVFETTETVVSAVFQPIDDASTYKIKYMPQPTTLVLNLHEYARLRESVQQRVSDYVEDYVAYLPL